MESSDFTQDSQVHCISDLERLGSAKLSTVYREFINEGSMDMVTYLLPPYICFDEHEVTHPSPRENELAFDRYKIRQRILVNVEKINMSTEIFGEKVSMPLGLAPSGMQKLAHPDGEIATSRAAAKLGVCMAVASYATTLLEDVIAQRAMNPYVLQLTLLQDKENMRQLLQRADAANYKAILLSVDLPVLGKRLNEYRNEFTVPDDISWPNVAEQESTAHTENLVK